MCKPNVQLVANLGNTNISISNSNLDGTGAMGTVLQSGGSSNGTVVKTITIKSTGNTSIGMVRLFVSNNTGSPRFLIKEVMVTANDQTGVVKAFTATIKEPLFLQPGYILYASTQNGESFNIEKYENDDLNLDLDNDLNLDYILYNVK